MEVDDRRDVSSYAQVERTRSPSRGIWSQARGNVPRGGYFGHGGLSRRSMSAGMMIEKSTALTVRYQLMDIITDTMRTEAHTKPER